MMVSPKADGRTGVGTVPVRDQSAVSSDKETWFTNEGQRLAPTFGPRDAGATLRPRELPRTPGATLRRAGVAPVPSLLGSTDREGACQIERSALGLKGLRPASLRCRHLGELSRRRRTCLAHWYQDRRLLESFQWESPWHAPCHRSARRSISVRGCFRRSQAIGTYRCPGETN